MVFWFYHRGATWRRQHLEQLNTVPDTTILPACGREPGGVDAASGPPNVAVCAVHLATSLPFLAAILPPLPPITPNVKLPHRPNRLECGIRDGWAVEANAKSGKNGNVDSSSELCRAASEEEHAELECAAQPPVDRERRNERRCHRHLQHMPWRTRRAAQPARAELASERLPERRASQRRHRPAAHQRRCAEGQRGENGVVAQRRRRLDALAIQARMLLEEQRVAHALALLAQTDAPYCRPHRMADDGAGRTADIEALCQQREVQVAILTIGQRKTLVEAADGFQRVAA